VFVQTTKSTRADKTYLTYLVRESFRTAKGPRSRTVCNITGLPAPVRDIITASLRGQSFLPAQDLQLHCALDYGGLAVLTDAWQRYGLAALFASFGTKRQQGLLQAMVLARLLFPCAKLALAEQAEGTALAQACGLSADESFDEDDLYAAMDLLNGQWVALEKRLYQAAFPQAVRLVLYDLSSVYFEGKGPSKLSRYGHSSDHRSDRPQILLAVATDPEGVPLHVEVLRGNRTGNKTLRGLLRTLRRRFGIREATFVFDGGMSSVVNLKALGEAQLQFVTRLSNATMEALLADLGPEDQLELGDRSQVVELVREGKRYVIAGGLWRKERDEQRRSARMAKAQKALLKLAQVKRRKVDAQKLASQAGRLLERLKAHKYFTYQVDPQGQLQWAPKAEVIKRETQRDGWYLLHTNCAASACPKQQVLAHYKGLLDVEEAFCELKSFLEVRPVFHRRPDRVRNHVRLCFLAYWISARLGGEWRLAAEPGAVPRILRRLQTIRIGRLQVKDKPVGTLMTDIPKELNDTLEKLGLLKLFATLPASVL
jgi:Transposase DDE domain